MVEPSGSLRSGAVCIGRLLDLTGREGVCNYLTARSGFNWVGKRACRSRGGEIGSMWWAELALAGEVEVGNKHAMTTGATI